MIARRFKEDGQPIFLVGVPRSGTTLLAAMLASHSRLSCGPETSFFAALAKRQLEPLTRPETWPDAAADFLYSIQLGGQPVPHRFGITRDEISHYLVERSPSVGAILEALTDQQRQAAGKERWVEKSPIHLLYVRQIRRYFPRAPIVRIVRDPRDVALSLQRVPWGPDSLIGGLLYWRRFDAQSSRFFSRPGQRSWTLRYEDLIHDPESQLQALCGFLDEEYEPSMLDYIGVSENLKRDNETWKANIGKALDSSRSEAWRRALTSEQQDTALALVADRLAAYNYPIGEATSAARNFFWCWPLTEDASGFESTWKALLQQPARIWRASKFEVPQAVVLFGDPDTDRWLGQHRAARVLATVRISLVAMRNKLMGRPVLWVQQESSSHLAGICSRFLSSLLSLLGTQTAAISNQIDNAVPGAGDPRGQSQ